MASAVVGCVAGAALRALSGSPERSVLNRLATTVVDTAVTVAEEGLHEIRSEWDLSGDEPHPSPSRCSPRHPRRPTRAAAQAEADKEHHQEESEDEPGRLPSHRSPQHQGASHGPWHHPQQHSWHGEQHVPSRHHPQNRHPTRGQEHFPSQRQAEADMEQHQEVFEDEPGRLPSHRPPQHQGASHAPRHHPREQENVPADLASWATSHGQQHSRHRHHPQNGRPSQAAAREADMEHHQEVFEDEPGHLPFRHNRRSTQVTAHCGLWHPPYGQQDVQSQFEDEPGHLPLRRNARPTDAGQWHYPHPMHSGIPPQSHGQQHDPYGYQREPSIPGHIHVPNHPQTTEVVCQATSDPEVQEMMNLIRMAEGNVDEESLQVLKKQLGSILVAKTTACAAGAMNKLKTDTDPDRQLLRLAAIKRRQNDVVPGNSKEKAKVKTQHAKTFFSHGVAIVPNEKIAEWVTATLKLHEVGCIPDHVLESIVKMLTGGKEQSISNTLSKWEKGIGVLYRVTFFSKEAGDSVKIAVQVAGATFGAAKEPTGYRYGVYGTANGISWEEVKPVMDHLENLLSEQVWERAAPSEREAVQI